MEEKNSGIKGMIFDLDGTLVNTLYSLQYTMNQVLKSYSLEEISEEETKKFIGRGYRKFVEKSFMKNADLLYERAEKISSKDEELAMELDMKADDILMEIDEAEKLYLKLFDENFSYKAEAYEGMKETLETLKTKGIMLSVLTNKPEKQARKIIIDSFGNIFDFIYGDNGERPLKPEKSSVTGLIEKMGLKEGEVLLLGDSDTDIKAARNAGIMSVGCAYGFRGEKELKSQGADVIINSPVELLSLPLI